MVLSIVVTEKFHNRSYLVLTGDGAKYGRNRFYLYFVGIPMHLPRNMALPLIIVRHREVLSTALNCLE